MNTFRLRRPHATRDRQRGQGLVEFAMLVPVFLILLLGLLEFGYVFDHTMTLSYATREGARSGAAFGQGNTTTIICNPADNGLEVDKNIIAAVQRVLKAPGSQVVVSSIEEIRIFRASDTGTELGGNVSGWTYSAGAGPIVDGAALDFVRSTNNWNACSRDTTWGGVGNPPDSIGISIEYDYTFITPLSAVMGFFGPPGGAGMTINDRSVMALNPTD